MPNLSCKPYDEALFQIQTLNLVVAEPVEDVSVNDVGSAYVWKQTPEANTRIYTGDTVTVFLTGDLPSDCIDE